MFSVFILFWAGWYKSSVVVKAKAQRQHLRCIYKHHNSSSCKVYNSSKQHGWINGFSCYLIWNDQSACCALHAFPSTNPFSPTWNGRGAHGHSKKNPIPSRLVDPSNLHGALWFLPSCRPPSSYDRKRRYQRRRPSRLPSTGLRFPACAVRSNLIPWPDERLELRFPVAWNHKHQLPWLLQEPPNQAPCPGTRENLLQSSDSTSCLLLRTSPRVWPPHWRPSLLRRPSRRKKWPADHPRRQQRANPMELMMPLQVNVSTLYRSTGFWVCGLPSSTFERWVVNESLFAALEDESLAGVGTASFLEST